MSADDETSDKVLKGELPNKSKNSEGWSISDVSLGSSDRMVISGCKHATGETFLSIFLVTCTSNDPQTDAKYMYSREFNKNHNPDLCRLVSFLDEIYLITCFDKEVEKICIVNDELVKSGKLPFDAASCLCVKEKQVFIGFRKSCDVTVLDSDLNKVRLISLEDLQDGWPMDLTVAKDSLVVCSQGCVPRKALCFAENDGQLSRRYTNPQNDDCVPLSLTVSAEADLVAVLWKSPPRLTIYSFSLGHCLVVADVGPAERVRSVGQDKLVMVDGNGEMKFFLYEEFFTLENLAAILSSLLSNDERQELMDFFGVSSDQMIWENGQKIDSSDINLKDLFKYFEDDGIIQSGNVTEIIEAFTHLGKEKAFLSPLEAYQKYSGLTRLTDNDPKSCDPKGGVLPVEDGDKRKKFTESDGDSEEDGDAASWTSDDEPSSSFIPDENQKDGTSEQNCLSPEGNLRNPSVSRTSSHSTIHTSLTNDKILPSENNGDEEGQEEMDTIDENDITMEEEQSNINSDMTIEETVDAMMDEIQALKQQNQLILSYLKTQPLPSPSLCQHSSSNQASLPAPSSLYTQTLSDGQSINQASVYQTTQVNVANQKSLLPMQQLQSMVQQQPLAIQVGPYVPGTFHQVRPGLSAPLGTHHQVTQTTQVPTISQSDPTSVQNSVVSPPQILPPGQQPDTIQPPLAQPTQPHPPPSVQQSQTSQPPPLSSMPHPQSANPPPPANPPLPVQPNQAKSSPSHTSPITQSSQTAQQPQPANNIPQTQIPPSNLQPYQRVPFYPYPPVYPNQYGNLPVRFSPHPLMYFPLPPNVGRPPLPAHYPIPVNHTVPGKPAVPTTSGSLTHIPTHTEVVATSIPSSQPAQPNLTITVPEQTSHIVLQSPIVTPAPNQVVSPAVLSAHSGDSARTPSSSVIPLNVVDPSDPTAHIGYGFEALPPKVKSDIAPHKEYVQGILHRNAIVRILADYFFSSQERMECNCNGKNGFRPLNSVKLEKIKYVIFELLKKYSVGYPQLDENLEWRRLCKVIDTHNRGHRIKIRIMLKESSPHNDIADT